MPRNRLTRLIKKLHHKSRRNEGTKEDLWREFWTHETETSQQVAQLLDSYMMMMMMMMILVYNFQSIVN
jgi:type VI protein secretion system component VasF